MSKWEKRLREAEKLVPARYKTTALINMGALIFIALVVTVLSLQMWGMSRTIKDMARTIKDQETTIALLDYRIGKLEKQVERQMEMFDEATYAQACVASRRPDLPFAGQWQLALKMTRGAHKYAIPLQYVVATAWAETDFHWNAVGPCGERSMVQVMRSTFYGMRPNGDWNDLDQVFDAGLHYLRVCYQNQQARAPDDYRVVFAFYNAGNRADPRVAVSRAWRHMPRVERVWKMMEGVTVA